MSSIYKSTVGGSQGIEIAPYLAPLPLNLIEYSFGRRYQTEIQKPPPIATPAQAWNQVTRIWESYLADVRAARQTLMEKMDLLVQHDANRGPHQKQLNHVWIAEQLAQLSPAYREDSRALSAYSITNYVKKGIIRKFSSGVYDPESVLAACILRATDQTRERNWAPLEKVLTREEGWYCWSQEYPGAPIQPCPYPDVPINLPRATLLYTRFACASWNNSAWLRLDKYRGAITFSGWILDQRMGTSNMSLDDLEVWEPGIKRTARSTKYEMHQAGAPMDMSLGLALVLNTIARYRYSGILQAEVSHLPQGPVKKGRCTIQLVAGQVVSCAVEDLNGQPYEVALDVITHIDTRRGPFAWTFLPQQAAPEDIHEHITRVLRRVAAPIFSASNIHKV